LYCAHTSMDTTANGINRYLADALSLCNQEYLEETNVEQYLEVAVHVPESHACQVRAAMTAAGAGNIGDYSECTYNISGKGMFRPNSQASPFIGKTGAVETVDEIRISTVCPKGRLQSVLQAIHDAHPYEEPAISALVTCEPQTINAGLGIVGDLEKAETAESIISCIKEKLDIDLVRVSGDLDQMIDRIAVCGGAAGDMAGVAKAKGAQLYLTGEIKHNFYVEEQGMVLVEAGHYDTEKCFCKVYAQGLQKMLDDVNYKVAIYIASLHRPYVNI
ncbi:MAG: Nif3-like dinuclear metal center hexameric protein, partial [Christensenella sp.]|uniref:Nif3-like dinuclear metal center hexameric protein n=1 Tax=Christensenella sp. TaxID=1935934 RepID=UPI002B1FB5C9